MMQKYKTGVSKFCGPIANQNLSLLNESCNTGIIIGDAMVKLRLDAN